MIKDSAFRNLQRLVATLCANQYREYLRFPTKKAATICRLRNRLRLKSVTFCEIFTYISQIIYVSEAMIERSGYPYPQQDLKSKNNQDEAVMRVSIAGTSLSINPPSQYLTCFLSITIICSIQLHTRLETIA